MKEEKKNEVLCVAMKGNRSGKGGKEELISLGNMKRMREAKKKQPRRRKERKKREENGRQKKGKRRKEKKRRGKEKK